MTDSALDHRRAFYSEGAWPDAPNPALDIEGFGPVGIPLGNGAAQALAAQCNQAPFGKGERTIVDTTIRDTWELEPSKFTIKNPSWENFIAKMVCEACKGLGINIEASKPKAELYKLLLYETGSQ